MAKKKSLAEKIEIKDKPFHYQAVVVGASAGGFEVFSQLFPRFKKNFSIPVIVVQHLHPESDGAMVNLLNDRSEINIIEADEKETLCGGHIYFAPANYHLLIERDNTISLSTDAKVNYCRPSVDVLFESAVDVFKSRMIGVLLTGANADGAEGLQKIKNAGGVTIVQTPETAYADAMPKSAIELFNVDYVLNPDQIVPTLEKLSERTIL